MLPLLNFCIKVFARINTFKVNKFLHYTYTFAAHWKEALLQHIDADQLPVTYGGSQVDDNGDPRCISKVRI